MVYQTSYDDGEMSLASRGLWTAFTMRYSAYFRT